jgi:hypothetical protein
MDRQVAKDEDHSVHLTALRAKLADAEGRLGRLYAAIENGIADPADATLKDRVAAVRRSAISRRSPSTVRWRKCVLVPGSRRKRSLRSPRRCGRTFSLGKRPSGGPTSVPSSTRSNWMTRKSALLAAERSWKGWCGRRGSASWSAQFCSEVAAPEKSNSCPPDSWCGRDRVLQKNATPPAFPFDPGVEWRLLARR